MKVFIASAANKDISKDYIDLAYKVSEAFAKRDFDLYYGAADYSMMGACYKAFVDYDRKIYAYTVPKYESDLEKLPKAKGVVVTDTLLRFRKFYFNCDYIVILPGGVGTAAELFSSIEEYRSSYGNKKIIIVDYKGYFKYLIKWLRDLYYKGFLNNDDFKAINIIKSAKEIDKLLDKLLKGE